jgi:hypothetical protein
MFSQGNSTIGINVFRAHCQQFYIKLNNYIYYVCI